MASFLDNPELLTRFKPYIPQVPVETESMVGMELQRRYDEGVQKIQSSIDRIAGLDIIRDVDKKYLQSKLGELGNKLKGVAGGDFSNYQLTNHVAGMAGSIGKDPNVVTAVGSTAFYRKQAEQMQNDTTSGKGNPANNFRFNKRANEWLSSQELGKAFNTNYIPPIDMWAKIKDIAKEVGVDVQDIQQMYQTDTQGNIIYEDIIDPVTKKSVGKKATWNPVMVEKVLKGKDAGKILKAFEAALTPADYQQLAIEGEYSKASYTPEMLKSDIVNGSAEQLDFTNNRIQELKIAILQETQKNDKNPEKVNSLSEQLEYFNKLSKNLISSRDKSLSLVDSDPDGVRGTLYTNNYLFNMAKTLSSQEMSTKYLVNPMFDITMRQNEFNRNTQQDRVKNWQWSKEQELEWANFGYLKDKDTKEFALKLSELSGGRGALNEPITVTSESMIKEAVENNYSAMVKDRGDIDYKITLDYYKRTNATDRLPSDTDAQFEAKMKNKIAKDSGGDIETYTAKIATKQLSDWSTSEKGSGVPAEYKGLMKRRKDLTKSIEITKMDMEEVNEQSRIIAEQQGLKVPSEEEIKKNLKEATIYLGGNVWNKGKPISLSKQDILDFAYARPGIFKGKERKERKAIAEERLKTKFGEDYPELREKLYELENLGISKGTGISTGLHPAIAKAADLINYNDYKELSKIQAQLYIDKGMIPQPTSINIERGKTPEDDFKRRMSQVIDKYTKNEIPDYDREQLQKEVLSDPNPGFKLHSDPGAGQGAPIIYTFKYTNSKTGKVKDMRIDRGDYYAQSGMEAPTNQPVSPIIRKVMKTGTTNLSGSDDPAGAWFSAEDFPNLKNYVATGDIIADKDNPNIVYMKIHLYDKEGNYLETLTFPDDRHTDQKFFIQDQNGNINRYIETMPSAVTDETIIGLKNKK